MRKLSMDELNRLSVDDYRKAIKLPVVVVMDNIRSMNNIGSVFRTADAFRIKKIWLCGISATPPHREIHKTALGATESVDWEYTDETLTAIESLIKEGFTILSVEQTENSIPLQEFRFAKDKCYAFVFGNEVKGVDQKVINASHGCIEIPQSGTKHSLNVAVSAGIVLWELYKPVITNLKT